jgi:hypothetical protein
MPFGLDLWSEGLRQLSQVVVIVLAPRFEELIVGVFPVYVPQEQLIFDTVRDYELDSFRNSLFDLGFFEWLGLDTHFS